jgi:linoleoyl-CoA desaturase
LSTAVFRGDETIDAKATELRTPKFAESGGFQSELRRRVGHYFALTGQRERDCRRMYVKTAVVIAWFAASYVALVFFAPLWWMALPLATSFALAAAAVTFNVQHDGGHGAYSDRTWINRLAAFTMDLVGASSYLWRVKHGVYHHTYTNVPGHDTDIDVGALARLAPQQPRRLAHRWQHYYMWALYGLMAVRWHLMGDFMDVARGKIGPHRVARPRGWDLALFVGGKCFSLGLFLGLPMIFHPVWIVVLYYLLAAGIMSLVLAVVFQLAHCVEEAEFPEPTDGTGRMTSAWAEHQVETTVDFARRSRVLSWLLGGLNFQVEHHLFPRVCHVHYPALSRIVEQVCREFGVRYTAHATLFAGIRSHFRWLRRMGSAATV